MQAEWAHRLSLVAGHDGCAHAYVPGARRSLSVGPSSLLFVVSSAEASTSRRCSARARGGPHLRCTRLVQGVSAMRWTCRTRACVFVCVGCVCHYTVSTAEHAEARPACRLDAQGSAFLESPIMMDGVQAGRCAFGSFLWLAGRCVHLVGLGGYLVRADRHVGAPTRLQRCKSQQSVSTAALVMIAVLRAAGWGVSDRSAQCCACLGCS